MNNALAIRDAAIMPQSFEGMLGQAEVLVKSGLLPQSVKTPAAAVAIMLTGRELGIPPMQAFRSIYVVNGNPTISTELMAALLLQAGVTYQIEHLDTETATISFKRPNGMTFTSTFTMKDAAAAGLAGKGTWKQYPKDMLYNRAFSSGARKIAPDVLAKLYTPEEIAPDAVAFDGEQFEVIDAETRVVPESPRKAPESPFAGTEEIETGSAETQDPTQSGPSEDATPSTGRPYPPEKVKAGIALRIKDDDGAEPEDGLRGLTVGTLNGLFPKVGKDQQSQMRHSLTQWLVGKPESASWSRAECQALLAWAGHDGANGKTTTNPVAIEEAGEILGGAGAPQEEMPF